MLTDTRKSPNAGLQGLPFSDVEWTGGLYKERFDTCTASMVPHLQKMFESRDISHVLENFKIAAGDADGDFDGTVCRMRRKPYQARALPQPGMRRHSRTMQNGMRTETRTNSSAPHRPV